MDVIPAPTLSDPTLIMRELTHRINNEFASAICMISAAALRCADQEALGILDQVKRHLEQYARVHHALRMPELGGPADAGEYLRNLCDSVSRSKLDGRNIRLDATIQPLVLTSEQCWMLGMVTNELITNSARHAFDEKGGVVRVSLLECEGMALCMVSDNGRKSASARPNGGLKIIKALAEMLEGTIAQRFEGHGSSSIISFPIRGGQ